MEHEVDKTPTVGSFVAAVMAWQTETGMNDETFAAHLGITKGYWSLLKRGRRDGGLRAEKFVHAVLGKRPEFEFYFAADLRRRRALIPA